MIMTVKHKNLGGSFNYYLEDQGLLEGATETAMKRVMAWIHLPRDITKDQIDKDQPVLLYYPSAAEPIEPIRQYVFQHGRGSHKRTYVLAYYDKAELMTAVPGNGSVDLEVVGSLKSGQYFYGSDTVRIIDRRWRRWFRR